MQCSREMKVCGVIGLCVSAEKKAPHISENVCTVQRCDVVVHGLLEQGLPCSRASPRLA
jgi:hypothetical protein